MYNETIVPLLEEYVNQMKIEMKNLNECGHLLKSEVKVLQNTITNYSERGKKCDTIFLDYEKRLRELEKHESEVQVIKTKLNNTDINVKTVTGHLQWI